LRHQDKRAFRNFPARDVTFGLRNFVDRSAEMDCSCATALFRFPRDRRRQRVVDFENSRSVPKILQAPAITNWQLVVGDSSELPHCCVKKCDLRLWKVIHFLDTPVDVDFAAELEEIFGERVRD
jgi:hypothetical protein